MGSGSGSHTKTKDGERGLMENDVCKIMSKHDKHWA